MLTLFQLKTNRTLKILNLARNSKVLLQQIQESLPSINNQPPITLTKILISNL